MTWEEFEISAILLLEATCADRGWFRLRWAPALRGRGLPTAIMRARRDWFLWHDGQTLACRDSREVAAFLWRRGARVLPDVEEE